ncbi:MAG: OmpA family protein, partial [Ignavibacteriales bacterium]|nr:OmpA family protein [Ignavibacteriales bacterium]
IFVLVFLQIRIKFFISLGVNMKFFGNLFVIFFAVMVTSVFSQNSKLYEIELSIEKANKLNAAILSPANYGKGMLYYDEVKRSITLNKQESEITEQKKYALENFNNAIEISEKAIPFFEKVINERILADKYNSKNYAPELWNKAEENLEATCLLFEKGEIKNPDTEANNLIKLYHDAEIDAAKRFYIPEIKKNIALAEDNDAEDNAPATFTAATQLLALVEQELTKSPVRADFVRENSFRSYQEIKHALYISDIIEKNKKDRKTSEDIILNCEKALKDLHNLFETQEILDKGIESSSKEIYVKAEKNKKEISILKEELKKLKQEFIGISNNYTTAKNELATVKAELEKTQTEKAKLEEIVGTVEKAKEQFEIVKSKFLSYEANVLQISDKIIIRLIGLSFPSGKSTIESQYFSLLTKVIESINLFPKANVTVEGHTDSQGNDSQNLELSEERAFAVFQYLTNNIKIPMDHFFHVGYGETKPIASNDTKEGREQNRRIDIVIEPNFYK